MTVNANTPDPPSVASPIPRHIVIIGTGIIGLSTAYYLTTLLSDNNNETSTTATTKPTTITIHLLDSSPKLFHCASGRAGGFLARDWFSPAVADVGALSFDLHRQLADEFNGAEKWGYVPTLGISVVLNGKNGVKNKNKTSGDNEEDDSDDSAEVEDGVRAEDWLFNGTSRVRAAVGNGYDGEEVEKDERDVPWWFDVGNGAKMERMSTGETTGTVNPLHLCQFLLEKVKERGVVVKHPVTVRKANLSSTGSLNSITFTTTTSNSDSSEETLGEGGEDEHTIPCNHLLISSGVWSPIVFKTLFPKSPQKIPITSLSGHHIILRPKSTTSSTFSTYVSSTTTKSINSNLPSNLSHTVFVTPPPSRSPASSLSSNPTDIFSFSPEIFARSNGDIYFAGLNSSTIPLPVIATDVHIIPSEVSKLERLSRVLIPDAEVVSSGLCHRPVTNAGRPIVTRIRDQALSSLSSSSSRSRGSGETAEIGGGGGGGVFIAAGHGPWGISMSLGTGKVMAEMMLGMKTSADVSKLDIHQF